MCRPEIAWVAPLAAASGFSLVVVNQDESRLKAVRVAEKRGNE